MIDCPMFCPVYLPLTIRKCVWMGIGGLDRRLRVVYWNGNRSVFCISGLVFFGKSLDGGLDFKLDPYYKDDYVTPYKGRKIYSNQGLKKM